VQRPPGSTSKLRTFRDGWRILLTITNLMRNERPLLFFWLTGLVAVALARRFPIAILCSARRDLGRVCGERLILDLIAHVRREAKRLVHLQHVAPRAMPGAAPRVDRRAAS
jgi:hypothetical protein